MVFYDGDRVWFDLDVCPGCGVDHSEMEFKRVDGRLVARCYRSESTLVYDEERKEVSLVVDEETPKV